MLRNYLSNVLDKSKTPQSEPIPGSNQVANSAGGYSFAVDSWTRLRRFLILGSEGGSYYATERKLTMENVVCLDECIKADGLRTVKIITEVSDGNLAAKNDPAIFALAVCASKGDDITRRAALEALPIVCRIPTHLFHFAEYIDNGKLRGWGRGMRNAISAWYLNRPADKLAFHVAKYQQRDGWSHRDLLRLAHPRPTNDSFKTIFHYCTHGWDEIGELSHPDKNVQILWAMERAKVADEKELLKLIEEYHLPMECIPTDKQSAAVYEALLPTAGLTWLIRNLGNLSKKEVLKAGQYTNIKKVVSRLTDVEQLKKGRIHPIAVLTALMTYRNGKGTLGKGEWPVVEKVAEALDEAFYLAFQAVEPSDKRYLLGLDVSGSMATGEVCGVAGLSPRVASAAMAMVTNGTEPWCESIAFTGDNRTRANNSLTKFDLSKKDRLTNVLARMDALPFGGTDCALPMIYAMQNLIEVDTFVIYTDSETWHGNIHPSQALEQYRQKMGIPARLVVCGMLSSGFTIADPKDAGQMDVIGFSSDTPAVISNFAAGRI